MAEITARMDELESRLAFQDDTIESLNQVVARQDRDLQNLQQRLAELSGRLTEINDAVPVPAAEHEVPPHY